MHIITTTASIIVSIPIRSVMILWFIIIELIYFDYNSFD